MQKNEPAENSSLTEAKRQEVSGQKTQKYFVNWGYKLPNAVNKNICSPVVCMKLGCKEMKRSITEH